MKLDCSKLIWTRPPALWAADDQRISITTQPVGKTVAEGATAKFTVKATGTGLKYQWQYRTSSTGKWQAASATGNKTATLSVPGTAARNGFQYRCKITDGSGNVKYSNAATLTVK